MLLHKKTGKYLVFYLSLFIMILMIGNSVLLLTNFPKEINIIQGQSKILSDSVFFNIVLDKNNNKNVDLKNTASVMSSFTLIKGNQQGCTEGIIKLFDFLPVKKVKVNVIPDLKLVPSGEAIGVKIKTKGLLVVGMSSITSKDGRKYSPAADAGFEIGDIILQLDKKQIENEKDIVEYLNNRSDNKKNVSIKVERAKTNLKLSLKPVLSEEDNTYKMGLWVRDSIAGVGTMTFYDPKSKAFGALGHGITDVDSGVLIDISSGNILKSRIASIQKARKTTPGELVGLFYDSKKNYGVIDKNTSYGIYGKVLNPSNDNIMKPLSIGLSYSVREGPAKILTTIEDSKIEEFDVEIQKINKQNSAKSKSMLIKITDPKLLDKTGGIVQGMSGSPIIQDNKLIGAVTHVLINDPTRGYGIFIEWMIEEANIDLNNSSKAVVGQ